MQCYANSVGTFGTIIIAYKEGIDELKIDLLHYLSD